MTERTKFKYGPGLPGYGTKGVDGSSGLLGISNYFSDIDGDLLSDTLRDKLLNNEVLLAGSTDKIEGFDEGRVYQNGDYFTDTNTKVWVVDFDETSNYRDSGMYLNASGFFEEGQTQPGSPSYIRFHNPINSSRKLVDSVYTNGSTSNYIASPSSIYKNEPLYYANVNFVDDDLLTALNDEYPFQVWTTGELGNENSIALIKEGSQNIWHLGNLDAGENVIALELSLDFGIVSVNGLAKSKGLISSEVIETSGIISSKDASITGNVNVTDTVKSVSLNISGDSTLSGNTTLGISTASAKTFNSNIPMTINKSLAQNRFTFDEAAGTILTNYEFNANRLFDDEFNRALGIYTQVESDNVYVTWDLTEILTNYDSNYITATLFFIKDNSDYNQTNYNYGVHIDQNPIILPNIESTGVVNLKSLDPNTTYRCYIEISANGWSRRTDITSVTTSGGSISVNPTTVSLTDDQTAFSFEVTSSIDWELSSAGYIVSSYLPLSGTAGTTQVNVVTSANTDPTERTGAVIATGTGAYTGVSANVSLTQAAGDDLYISFNTGSITIDADITSFQFNVYSNTTWQISVNGILVNFVDANTGTNYTGNKTITCSLPANTSTEESYLATITAATSGGIVSHLYLIQSPAPTENLYINSNPEDFLNISQPGETLSAIITTSAGGWNITSYPAAWVTVTNETGLATDHLDITVYENFETSWRSTGITLALNDHSEITRTIGVVQTCFDPETPITMSDYSIKLLKDVKLGDKLLSFDIDGIEKDNSNTTTWSSSSIKALPTPATVVKLINGTYKEYYLINGIMKVTYEHRVMLFREGVYRFLAIEYAKVGDYLWSPSEGNVRIDTKEFIEGENPFIQMDVEETDVYLAHGLLVHNADNKI